MKFYSPLRYPGGKNKLAKFVALLCEKNHINGHYIEPYAGGASVALFLLLEGYVKEITINDLDRAIYAFWYSMLNDTKRFCNMILKTDITVKNWHKFKKIHKNKEKVDLFDLGFATFFLNRTNHSGVIDGGIIGGYQQKGDYKIDCRFNKIDLINRIKLISGYKDRIHVKNLDALDLIDVSQKSSRSKNTIFYFDPPYFMKGQSLYMNSYQPNDHREVSEKIKNINNARWIVSYDDVLPIRKLYKDKKIKSMKQEIIYTAHTVSLGKEIMFFDRGLLVPKYAK
ncbi:MAG: DNA adenine methylase [Candidatus Paceibacterota bacterium]